MFGIPSSFEYRREGMKCAFCKKDLEFTGIISRADTCPHCARYLRCCKQCKFYDPRSYNECKEVMAERIVDKERPNFCDFFSLKGPTNESQKQVEEAKRKLEALFKKH
jgi:hypothetical protein